MIHDTWQCEKQTVRPLPVRAQSVIHQTRWQRNLNLHRGELVTCFDIESFFQRLPHLSNIMWFHTIESRHRSISAINGIKQPPIVGNNYYSYFHLPANIYHNVIERNYNTTRLIVKSNNEMESVGAVSVAILKMSLPKRSAL